MKVGNEKKRTLTSTGSHIYTQHCLTWSISNSFCVYLLPSRLVLSFFLLSFFHWKYYLKKSLCWVGGRHLMVYPCLGPGLKYWKRLIQLSAIAENYSFKSAFGSLLMLYIQICISVFLKTSIYLSYTMLLHYRDNMRLPNN